MIRLVLLGVLFAAGPVPGHEVKPLTEAECEEYKLDPTFYRKGTWVQGILIATSEKVSDLAHLEAAHQILLESVPRTPHRPQSRSHLDLRSHLDDRCPHLDFVVAAKPPELA